MKICIIGNNLTSLILASILSKKNFNVKIYYNKLLKSNFKTRSLGITSKNLNYLEKYFKGISNKTNSICDINLLIQNDIINKKIVFNQKSEKLFNMVKYDDFISFIKSKVKKNKHISFKYFKKNYPFSELINDKKFELIINCESSNIFTNKLLKTRIFKNYQNKAFTTIIYHKKIKKNNTATQVFTSNGPIAYLPLSKFSTSIVFSYEQKKNKIITPSQVIEAIKKFNPGYKIQTYDKINNFNLNLRLPKNYSFKKILFFGDSLHSIHPLAGQGFNMTIRDIIKFDEIIENKINLGLNIDKSIYEEFEKIAKSYNLTFSVGIDFIYEFFRFNRNYLPKKISEKIFSFIDDNKKIKELGIKLANQGSL